MPTIYYMSLMFSHYLHDNVGSNFSFTGIPIDGSPSSSSPSLNECKDVVPPSISTPLHDEAVIR